jgi:hypothetical protein
MIKIINEKFDLEEPNNQITPIIENNNSQQNILNRKNMM